MFEKDCSWILNLKKGDKVYCVSSQYQCTDFFMACFVKSINKDTVTIADETGQSRGCFYKKNGEARVDHGAWSSRYTVILDPNDEKTMQRLDNYNVAKKFSSLFSGVTKLGTKDIKIKRMKELIPVMEAFLTEWNKKEEVEVK